ncbi:MAG: hypothetical protein ACOC2U_03055, partial [bacterium]
FEQAVARGWTPVFDWRDKTNGRTSPENCPHNPVGYKKGVVNAWKCVNFYTHETYFRVADLIDGMFCNHRDYKNMEEVLEKELVFE